MHPESKKNLVCPICNYEYIHPVKFILKNYQGNKKLTIDSDNINTEEYEHKSRGIIIEIWFTCEDGHTFVHEFWFHKGMTYLSCFQQTNGGLSTIWRD